MDALLLVGLLVATAMGGWQAHDTWNEWREDCKPHGICRICGKTRFLTTFGTLPPHSFLGRRCMGSLWTPDPLEEDNP